MYTTSRFVHGCSLSGKVRNGKDSGVCYISTLQQIQESIDDVSVNQRVSCGLNQFSLSTNFCGFHQVVDQLNKCSLIAIFDNKWYASNLSIHKPDKEIHLITRNARAF